MILCSIFRDAESYIDRFYQQIKELRAVLPTRLVIAEGDSTDHTYPLLIDVCTPDDLLLKVEHGGPRFASVDHPLRWRQIAAVCNVALTAAVRELHPDEPLVYIESDLIWDADTIDELVARVNKYPAVAPMSMQGGRFFDIWGHQKDGCRFSAHPPFYPGYSSSDSPMTQIDSAGSCFVLSHSAAQVAHFGHDDCIRGIGRSLYASGMALWLCPDLSVRHP